MSHRRLTGLIAATFTPFDGQGRLHLAQIGPMVDHLREVGVSGLYVCGTTGEGASLTIEERHAVIEAYVGEAAGQLPVVANVGHNSLTDSCRLAEHAQQIGVHSISANAPSYFKCADLDTLIESMAMVAGAAPELPFYYYHIPLMNGASVDMVAFLERGSRRIPNLVGLKFAEADLATYQACAALNDGQFDVLWGYDEMLLGALATGARGAIGSTYNIATALYHRIINAFHASDWRLARRLQAQAVWMVRVIYRYPFHPAMKEILKMLGLDFGACRLPQKRLSAEQVASLRRELEEIGFFDWAQAPAPPDKKTARVASPHFCAKPIDQER